MGVSKGLRGSELGFGIYGVWDLVCILLLNAGFARNYCLLQVNRPGKRVLSKVAQFACMAARLVNVHPFRQL